MLARLAEGEASVNELAEPFPVSVQAISKHLKVLTDAGLVVRDRAAQRRPARLAGRRLADAVRWLGMYRDFWPDSFDELDRHLHRTAPTRPVRPPGRTRRGEHR